MKIKIFTFIILNLIVINLIIFIINRNNKIKKLIKKNPEIELFKISKNPKINRITKDIIIIDNFYKNPEKVREYGLKNVNKFIDHTSIYHTTVFDPNLKYFKVKSIVKFIEKLTKKKINENDWNTDINDNSNGYFQFLTKNDKPAIHYDLHWNLVIFLTPNAPKNHGTTIYKNKKTGIKKALLFHEYQNINKKIIQKTKKDLWEQGEREKFDKWEKIFSAENIFNRAFLFDGRQFHCPDNGFGSNDKNSRFFQTFFSLPFYRNIKK